MTVLHFGLVYLLTASVKAFRVGSTITVITIVHNSCTKMYRKNNAWEDVEHIFPLPICLFDKNVFAQFYNYSSVISTIHSITS